MHNKFESQKSQNHKFDPVGVISQQISYVNVFLSSLINKTLNLCMFLLKPIIDLHKVVSSLTNFTRQNLTLMKILECVEGVFEKTKWPNPRKVELTNAKDANEVIG
jgi:hypothetical protein